MDLLDSPTLLNIFKKLPLKDRILFRRVCTRWHGLFMMRELFKNQRTIGLRLTENNLKHVDKKILQLYRKEMFLCDNEIVRYQCGDDDHEPQPSDVIEAHAFQISTHFISIVEQYPNLKCIDIRGMDLTKEAVDALIEYSKNVECVHINFLNASDLDAWKKFVDRVIPNIRHLSIDSCIKFKIAGYSPYTHLFSNATQLERLSIVLYANSEIDVQSFRALKPCLREISIFSIGFKNVDKVFDNIRQSDALNSIVNVRLHSHSVCHLQTVMSEHIGLFRNLEALSMSGAFVNDLANLYLNSLERLENLTDLSLFFNRIGSVKLFKTFSEHQFRNIVILRLGFVKIKGNFDLRETFPNVELLILVNAWFDNTFSKSIINCENLRNLHIKYESQAYFMFTEERANIFKAIIEQSKLKELVVKNLSAEWKNFLVECAERPRFERGFQLTFI